MIIFIMKILHLYWFFHMTDGWRLTYRYQLNIFYSIDISFDSNIDKKIN
jgi:hypothetical protein